MSVVLLALFVFVVRLISDLLDDPRSPASRRRAARVATFTVAIAIAGLWIALAPWPLSGAVPILLFAAPVLSGPLVRFVLIPTGRVRAAHLVTRLVPIAWAEDRTGARALAGARALLRQGTPSEGDAEWLRQELLGAPLRGAGLCAHGFILAARGQLPAAREVLASVASLDPRACPDAARRLAAEWLAAEAFARGDLRAVVELGRSRASGAAVWLMGGAAERLMGDPLAPGRAALIVRWLLARSRLATLPLLRRALAAEVGRPPLGLLGPRPEPEHFPGGDDWTRAAASQAAAAANGGAALARAAAAWDRLLGEAAAERRLRERAQALGGNGHGALTALRAALQADLAAILRESGCGLEAAATDGLLGSSARALRDELLGEIELGSEALKRRTEKTVLPAIDEWREWSSLCRSYQAAVGLAGDQLRRVAYPVVNSAVGNHAAWLYNERGEKALGNAMFAWLHAEAVALDDERAAALHAKNVSCGV